MTDWTPAYDAEELQKLIRTIRARIPTSNFFDLRNAVSPYCQGDIIQVPCDSPVIDSTSNPATLPRNGNDLWLLIGNTCDFARPIENLEWTQVIPLDLVGTDATIEVHELSELMAYRSSRYFYVPSWQSGKDDRHYLGRFSEIVTMHKDAVVESKLIARLSHVAWFLLNACTVRFLARGDRRFLH